MKSIGKVKKTLNLAIKVISGLIISLLAIPSSVEAVPKAPRGKVNPCPKIYYEEPYNSKLVVPVNCSPNAATERWKRGASVPNQQLIVVPETTNVVPIQPPIPENRSSAIATVTPVSGKVSLKLKNDTNTRIAIQVIKHTKTRYIEAGEEVVLRDLPTPTTVTMMRQDKGFIKVIPLSQKSEITDKGMLTISLDESAKFDNNQGVLRIQKDGEVFLN
ncbi:MAG: hypothetical protein AAF378_03125 [Cyanobacteria bacterium P01_A01_bin.84]